MFFHKLDSARRTLATSQPLENTERGWKWYFLLHESTKQEIFVSIVHQRWEVHNAKPQESWIGIPLCMKNSSHFSSSGNSFTTISTCHTGSQMSQHTELQHLSVDWHVWVLAGLPSPDSLLQSPGSFHPRSPAQSLFPGPGFSLTSICLAPAGRKLARPQVQGKQDLSYSSHWAPKHWNISLLKGLILM